MASDVQPAILRPMSLPTQFQLVPTQHGRIAVEECGRGDLPIFFIHGNSTCRGVFRKQLQGRLAVEQRLIAMDLPGHGDSSDAPQPAVSYTLTGYADAAVRVLELLQVSEAIVVGWSLGGHIAIEMLRSFPGMRGLVIVGAPPVARDDMAQGFKDSIQNGAAGRQDLSREDIDGFVQAIFGPEPDPFLPAAVARADGRARKRVFEARKESLGTDQREAVETFRVPLAVVNGAEDPIVNLDYVDSLAYANLWEGRCHRIAGVGHAPFWQAPQTFDALLERFARDVNNGPKPEPW